ncbi:hypothetical protein DFJ74DRAFT_709635 [Hyaloraphidium curvatum]|nr:hypothetical protein DFJ74DRAFT_709635 [Hyaloraphidium curvatum]
MRSPQLRGSGLLALAAFVILLLCDTADAWHVMYYVFWRGIRNGVCRPTDLDNVVNEAPIFLDPNRTLPGIRSGPCPPSSLRNYTAAQAGCRNAGLSYLPFIFMAEMCVDVPDRRLPSYRGFLGLPVDEPLFRALQQFPSGRGFILHLIGPAQPPGCPVMSGLDPIPPNLRVPNLAGWSEKAFFGATDELCRASDGQAVRSFVSCGWNRFEACGPLADNLASHPARRSDLRDYPIPGVKYTTAAKKATTKRRTSSKRNKVTTKKGIRASTLILSSESPSPDWHNRK